MLDFFQVAWQNPFILVSLAGAILACSACGVVGTFIVARRITYIAGAIAHCVLAGLGAAYYLQRVHNLTWCNPMLGAIAAALIAAGIIAWVSLRANQREDTVIGAIWATGMAIGVMFIRATPGANPELMSRLFGNIMLITASDLYLIGALNLAIIIIVSLFYKQLFAVCFDEQFAKAQGLNAEAYYILLLMLTALTVVLLASVVGIIMVIALITLPVAISNLFLGKLWKIMLLSVALSIFFTITGFWLSYDLEFPPGATTIVIAGFVYLLMLAVKAFLPKRKPAFKTLKIKQS